MQNDRVGMKNTNFQGLEMTIIKYNNASDIVVKFEDGREVSTSYKYFSNGGVRNKFVPSVKGVGIIGSERVTDSNGKDIISYIIWRGMLERCYDGKYQEKKSTYKNCIVCEEWIYYSTFKEWYDKNYYKINSERVCLDKDILAKGNKLYSPETCVFVPERINSLFTKCNKSRGELPIGVYLKKESGKFQSRCNYLQDGKKYLKHIGYFKTPEEAFNAYKIFKEKYIKQVADEYKHKIPQKLYDAMYRYEVEITD